MFSEDYVKMDEFDDYEEYEEYDDEMVDMRINEKWANQCLDIKFKEEPRVTVKYNIKNDKLRITKIIFAKAILERKVISAFNPITVGIFASDSAHVKLLEWIYDAGKNFESMKRGNAFAVIAMAICFSSSGNTVSRNDIKKWLLGELEISVPNDSKLEQKLKTIQLLI